MEIVIEVLLDPSGFLRRECPTCEQEFKWFSGTTNERPEDFLEPENYFCPYCGVPSGHDTWWTHGQLEYAQAAAAGPVMKQLEYEFNHSFRSSRKSAIRFEVSRGSTPQPPDPLVDPDDMMMVEPPCHPFEPLKVSDGWAEPLHCLMCGERFRI